PGAPGWVRPAVDEKSTGRAGRLTLRVLRGLTGLLQTVLLTLGGPGVPGQEAGLLQRRTVVDLVLHQRPGDRQAQRAGLARGAAATQVREDVEALRLLGQHQRFAHQLLLHLAREVVLQRPAVQRELAGTRHQPDPDDGLLAA